MTVFPRTRAWLAKNGRGQHLGQLIAFVTATILFISWHDSRNDVASQAQAATQNEIAQLQSAQAAVQSQVNELKRAREITDAKLDRIADIVSRVDQSLKYLTDAEHNRSRH